MAEKPPIQKPPVRAGGFAPQPPVQPVYAPPVYVPAYPLEPAQVTAPSTSFLAVLGWTSLIWAVGLIVLCVLLRVLGSEDFGLSLASVSMYLSFVIVPLALLVGLFAIFEIGRETTGDSPKPTLFRFAMSSVLIVLGIVTQVGFSRYLTSSAATVLVDKLAGTWERTDNPPPNQFGQFNQFGPATVMKTEGKGFAPDGFSGDSEDHAAQPSGWTVEFTRDGTGGTVTIVNGLGTLQAHYEATGTRTFSIARNHLQPQNMAGDFRIEFVGSDEIIMTGEDWFANQSQLSGRYRRVGGASGDADVPEEFAADLKKLREQLKEHREKSKKLMSYQARLERDRTNINTELRQKGIHSVDELKEAEKKDPTLGVKRRELVSLTKDIKTAEEKRKEWDLAIQEIESTLRQLDRKIAQKQVEITDYGEVSTMLHSLKERMESSDESKAVKAINDQALLEEALGH